MDGLSVYRMMYAAPFARDDAALILADALESRNVESFVPAQRETLVCRDTWTGGLAWYARVRTSRGDYESHTVASWSPCSALSAYGTLRWHASQRHALLCDVVDADSLVRTAWSRDHA